MSLGDDNGYGNDSGRTDDGYSTIGGTRQTRTRLPDGEGGDGYGTPRRPARKSRSLVMMVGVVVLLIAAIAFANMGGGGGNGDDGGGSGGGGSKPDASSTAATGTKPVTGKNGAVPSGFAHDEQGRRARLPITQWHSARPTCSTRTVVAQSLPPSTPPRSPLLARVISTGCTPAGISSPGSG